MNYSYCDMGANVAPNGCGKHANTPAIPMLVLCAEPYLVSALIPLTGKKLVVETVRGSQIGILMDVKPDHIVIGEPAIIQNSISEPPKSFT